MMLQRVLTQVCASWPIWSIFSLVFSKPFSVSNLSFSDNKGLPVQSSWIIALIFHEQTSSPLCEWHQYFSEFLLLSFLSLRIELFCHFCHFCHFVVNFLSFLSLCSELFVIFYHFIVNFWKFWLVRFEMQIYPCQ